MPTCKDGSKILSMGLSDLLSRSIGRYFAYLSILLPRRSCIITNVTVHVFLDRTLSLFDASGKFTTRVQSRASEKRIIFIFTL